MICNESPFTLYVMSARPHGNGMFRSDTWVVQGWTKIGSGGDCEKFYPGNKYRNFYVGIEYTEKGEDYYYAPDESIRHAHVNTLVGSFGRAENFSRENINVCINQHNRDFAYQVDDLADASPSKMSCANNSPLTFQFDPNADDVELGQTTIFTVKIHQKW